MTYQRLDLQDNVLTPVETADGAAFDGSVKLQVQSLRELRAMSLLDLASRAGMLPQHVQAIESGLQPTLPERHALATALSVPAELLE